MLATGVAYGLADAVREALTDLGTFSRLLGVEPRSESGGMVRCPFHVDRTPSLSLTFRDGVWLGNCHSCGAADNALGLILRLRGFATRGSDFIEGVREIAADLGIGGGQSSTVRRRPPPPRPEPKPEPDLGERFEVQRLIHAVLLDLCPLGPEGKDYFKRRGFHAHEIPNDWPLLPLPDEQRRIVTAIEGEIGRDAWLKLSGLAARDGRGIVFPNHRLVIPWPGAPSVLAGVAFLQRRGIDIDKGADGPKYIGPTGLTAPWPFGIEDSEIDGEGVVQIFVEGALDVLAVRALCRAEGVNWWPLGVPGASAWKREWARLGAGRKVFMGFDSDAAGMRGAWRIYEELTAAGARVSRMTPVHGKDWTDGLAWNRERRNSGRR